LNRIDLNLGFLHTIPGTYSDVGTRLWRINPLRV